MGKAAGGTDRERREVEAWSTSETGEWSAERMLCRENLQDAVRDGGAERGIGVAWTSSEGPDGESLGIIILCAFPGINDERADESKKLLSDKELRDDTDEAAEKRRR